MKFDRRTFWNEGYEQGIDYRIIANSEVKRILALADDAKTALDIGCGTGDLARKLYAHGLKVTGVDISDAAIEQARTASSKDISYKTLDIEKDDTCSLGRFDIVTVKLVLAFVEDRPTFIDKTKRLIEPGGTLVVINPVVTNEQSEMPKKLRKISVPEEVTIGLLKYGFDLLNRHEEKLSDYHAMITYVAKKNKPNYVVRLCRRARLRHLPDKLFYTLPRLVARQFALDGSFKVGHEVEDLNKDGIALTFGIPLLVVLIGNHPHHVVSHLLIVTIP